MGHAGGPKVADDNAGEDRVCKHGGCRDGTRWSVLRNEPCRHDEESRGNWPDEPHGKHPLQLWALRERIDNEQGGQCAKHRNHRSNNASDTASVRSVRSVRSVHNNPAYARRIGAFEPATSADPRQGELENALRSDAAE